MFKLAAAPGKTKFDTCLCIWSLSWHGKYSTLLMYHSCHLGIFTKILITLSAVPQNHSVVLMELHYKIFIRSCDKRMCDKKRWFTWDLLSTGQVIVQMSVVFDVFDLLHPFVNTDTSLSIFILLTITQTHWRLFHVKLRFMLGRNGLFFINAKLSKKIGSFFQFSIYTWPMGRIWWVLQEGWRS